MAVLSSIYRKLFRHFGPQGWWPGDTPFEIAVGAILTQNTSWGNASRAVGALKKQKQLSVQGILRTPSGRLARMIRSSGYFRQKTKRLKVFARYLSERQGSRIERMRRFSAGRLRKELLSLWGIGPETADSVLLYALEKPVFVVDAYTRRILLRHSLISSKDGYEEIQALFAEHLPVQVPLLNEYHALLVVLGKRYCHKSRPRCGRCPIRSVGKLRLEKTAVKM
ncbi:MAG: endonuclease III domain-containing protein [Candidatus Omnitrophica bacterium]|nr:endonuclease III domain-containing protein [Candidatus Omnitrophota bacterium]